MIEDPNGYDELQLFLQQRDKAIALLKKVADRSDYIGADLHEEISAFLEKSDGRD